MSQKEKSFQSKRGGGGQKFSGGGKGRPSGGGRGFTKSSEGDRGERAERRPARSFDRDSRPPRREGDSFKSDRPRKSFGDRDSRPPRDGGDRPYKKREFGAGEGRPARAFGDKPAYKKREGASSDRPRRDFGDKPYKKREFGSDSRPARRDGDSFKSDRPRKSFGDKPRRDFGDKPAYKKREFGASDRPRRDFGDKPYKKREFGDRAPYKKREFDDRPARSFDDQPAPNRDDIRQKLKSDRPSYGSPSPTYLYGVHAVSQALLNPKRSHKRLLCTDKGFESLQEAWNDAQEAGFNLPPLTTVEKEDIERLLPRDAVHQDVLLDCAPLEETFLSDVLISAGDDAKVLILDQVTDPHNVGAILRSAAAFGAIAVVVQTLHAPEITGVLAKTASGAVEHVPMVREVNLSRAMELLKKAGFFCIGLDEDGKQTIAKMNLTGKIALVLGAEGAGLRRLVAENCDELAKLPTQGPIGSLNVSNAAAVALYELARNGGK